MSRFIEKVSQTVLPMIAMRGTVAFPSVQIHLDLVRQESIRAFARAEREGGNVLLVTQRDVNVETPELRDLYKTGTVCRIKQISKSDGEGVSVTFEGVCRAKLQSMNRDNGYLEASLLCKTIRSDNVPAATQDDIKHILRALNEMKNIHPTLTDEQLTLAKSVSNPGLFADFVASMALLNYKNKQRILDCFNPFLRVERLVALLEEEYEFLKLEFNIHSEVRHRLDEHQKEFFLREQMKVIQQELGEDSDEIAEYAEKIAKKDLPEDVREKLNKELNRLSKTPFGAAESTVLRNYLDACLELPFGVYTESETDVAAASRILDEDHDGMTKVKERILEAIAVRKLAPNVKNQILCLVGPPGVGKTSIAASVARAMKRKYVRLSLGGIRDEADIRGHRKTYVGAMPGRIANAICEAGSMNPVIVLDEIDKLATSLQGDPASALLEVLDPEQNKFFRDHFLEIPLDLSDCVFIATANNMEGIPLPLFDRMEVMELHSYSREEKRSIAQNHLLPKQIKRHGLSRRVMKWTDEALYELIDFYTREAGVRNLEREIASVCRKTAKRIALGEIKTLRITPEVIAEMLGRRKVFNELADGEDLVGVVNGLAYTQAGGDLLKVEVGIMEGTGKIELTGSLGDVMKESAHIAISYIRTIASRVNVPADFYKTRDIHIHFPEGAVPKDGPSAGVTMTTALVSALSNTPVRHNVAMTGEVTLRGRVLPIGGLKEKTMAAYAAGVDTVLIPHDNVKDLEDIDPTVREKLRFVPCKTVWDVLNAALAPSDTVSKEDGRIPALSLSPAPQITPNV